MGISQNHTIQTLENGRFWKDISYHLSSPKKPVKSIILPARSPNMLQKFQPGLINICYGQAKIVVVAKVKGRDLLTTSTSTSSSNKRVKNSWVEYY
ncbi:hypothetical protein Glove_50g118 [Diversispora epigaea]|uniref:Uncharacterized protein n=1 Tax=Diversispora epigaea TaxID=1348612 RepID=A0A397JEU1_9GLOM|nr:hypothetical protein Glove_50g118 [Diversispora epigaea]